MHKKGDTGDMGNYRPVRLTNLISNVKDCLAGQAMYQHMVSNGILWDAQHNFVHQISGLLNLLNFLDGLTSVMEEDEDAYVCFTASRPLAL